VLSVVLTVPSDCLKCSYFCAVAFLKLAGVFGVQRAFKISKPQSPCPKCGNTTNFVGKAEQVCEDGCEVWVECVCGHNPFENNSSHCIESVWGDLSEPFLLMALDSWNELTHLQESPSSP